jgi:hypothetical protein
MACALTTSYNFLGCGGGAGGIQEVLMTEAANVTAYTVTANVITAITQAGVTVFRRYQLDKEMGMATANGTKTTASGAWIYEPQIDFTIKTLTIAMQAEIKLMAQNNLIMIIKDNNGVYWGFGFDRFMELMSASAETGTGMADFNGNKLSFKGKETQHIYQVDSSIIAGLLS